MIRIYASVIVVVVIIAGIAVSLNLIKTPKVFRPKAQVVGVALSLQPDTINLSAGQDLYLDVYLDSAQETVSALEIEVVYDYKMIRVDDIENTKVFSMELGKDMSKPGSAKLIVLSEPGSTDKKSGVIAKIKGKVLQNGNSEIGFSRDTRASAVGKLDDVLEAVSGAIVNAGGAGGGQDELQRKMDYMKDENRVNRALDEFYDNKNSNSANSEEESSNPIVKFTNRILNSVKNFVGGVNESVEDSAEKVIDK